MIKNICVWSKWLACSTQYIGYRVYSDGHCLSPVQPRLIYNFVLSIVYQFTSHNKRQYKMEHHFTERLTYNIMTCTFCEITLYCCRVMLQKCKLKLNILNWHTGSYMGWKHRGMELATLDNGLPKTRHFKWKNSCFRDRSFRLHPDPSLGGEGTLSLVLSSSPPTLWNPLLRFPFLFWYNFIIIPCILI